MSEPLRSAAADAEDTPPLPSNAEDRRAAAALSSLDAHHDEDDDGKPERGANSNIDQEALVRAISRLELAKKGGASGGGGSGGGAGGGGEKGKGKDAKEGGKEEVGGRKVKVEAADVGLLVSEISSVWYRVWVFSGWEAWLGSLAGKIEEGLGPKGGERTC